MRARRRSRAGRTSTDVVHVPGSVRGAGDSSDDVHVLQAVAFISSDSAYGGPVAVARTQSAGLEAAGFAVTLVAGWDGRANAPRGAVLFRARRLLRRSFASLVSPGLVRWAVRHVRAHDVVHVHFARDLIMMPLAALALAAGRPVVLQPHGMVRPDARTAVRIIDRLATRPILRRAAVVIALTQGEADGLIELGVDAERIRTIGNGVVLSEQTAEFARSGPRVVFASRLAERKRPVVFVQMAALVREWRHDVTFEVWGPDAGMLAEVNRTITDLDLSDVCTYRGALPNEQMLEVIAHSQVFVLPSFEEPFPMALLEAMSAGVPSVITYDTGVSTAAGEAGAAVVTDGSPEELAAAVRSLLDEPSAWARSAAAARRLVAAEFSTERAVELLRAAYARAVETASTTK